MNQPLDKEPLEPSKLQELVAAAQNAALSAYNPYSKFAVGCALLSKSGRIYRGCNIENASFSVTICAERVAASQAILQRHAVGFHRGGLARACHHLRSVPPVLV